MTLLAILTKSVIYIFLLYCSVPQVLVETLCIYRLLKKVIINNNLIIILSSYIIDIYIYIYICVIHHCLQVLYK